MVVVNVKWGKQKFEGVEVDVGEPVAVFKAQLFALTNVPPERQKVMGVKGGQLKDDADMSALGLKPNQNLMLMGTADALPEPPPEKVKRLIIKSLEGASTKSTGVVEFVKKQLFKIWGAALKASPVMGTLSTDSQRRIHEAIERE